MRSARCRARWRGPMSASGCRSGGTTARTVCRPLRSGDHGVWTPDMARRQARALLGQIAQDDNPAEEKRLDAKSMAVKALRVTILLALWRKRASATSGSNPALSAIAADSPLRRAALSGVCRCYDR
ncbi:MAG: DUF4102 domain-containing protein [Rhodospirillales bacterium]|nr:DUF4102 domain-containing protein [Rhodospirillales bacterium]